MNAPLASLLRPISFLFAAFLLVAAVPLHADWFGKDKQIPDWGLEAAKTKTPDYAKDASAVITMSISRPSMARAAQLNAGARPFASSSPRAAMRASAPSSTT